MNYLERVDEIITNCVKQYNLSCDGLTEKQFVEAIKQAIQCGDFKRLVRQGDNAQQVIYIPFESEQRYRARIKVLEDYILEHCNANPDEIA